MNTAEAVDAKILELKASGIPLTDAAWEAGLLTIGWPYIFGDRGQECTISHRRAVYNKGPDKPEYADVRKKCQAIRENNPTGSCAGCKWYPKTKRVRSYDCRGFTYWILLQIYNWQLKGAGATSQWNTESNWKAKGSIDTIPEDTLVCLFYTQKGNPKVMEHTGLGYKGETLECSGTVVHQVKRAKKWTHWGIPACVEGDIPVPTPTKPTLRRGDSGANVKELQEDLLKLGYDVGKTGADGKFGANTELAVKRFQGEHQLTADGICGKLTWTAIEKALQPQPVTREWTVHIPHLTEYQADALLMNYAGSWKTAEGDG